MCKNCYWNESRRHANHAEKTAEKHPGLDDYLGRCDYRGVCVGGADMREATLYTIHSQRVMCGDYFEMWKTCGPMPSLVQVREDGIIPVDMPTVEIKRLPVHSIGKIEYGERKTDYIVLEPELRKILEAPFAGELEKLELVKVKLDHENRQLKNALEAYESRIERFNTCNWFLRVWHVICGGRV